jgi:hypothetical protein
MRKTVKFSGISVSVKTPRIGFEGIAVSFQYKRIGEISIVCPNEDIAKKVYMDISGRDADEKMFDKVVMIKDEGLKKSEIGKGVDDEQ